MKLKTVEDYIYIKNGNAINYTVPQKVRVENLDKGIDVFMRVNNVYKDVAIKVKADDKELLSFKRKHMAPGDGKIMLPKSILESVNKR